MGVVVRISLRNLLRHRRRSVLLGTAIAFGTAILILANSFARGITDILFNRIIVYVSGHLSVNFYERGNYFRQVFHDREFINAVVDNAIPQRTSKQEAVGTFCRAIGNGRADNIVLIGIDLSAAISRKELKDVMQNFKMIEGDFPDLLDSTVENPLIISDDKAKYLNVKKGDIVRIRFTNVKGQEQAARLTVVGIFHPANVFMTTPAFVELRYLKPLMGYGPHDIANVQINIPNAKRFASRLADSLHVRLKPPIACIHGLCDSIFFRIYAMRTDSSSLSVLSAAVPLLAGDSALSFSTAGTIVSDSLARLLRLKPGDTLRAVYRSKHDSSLADFRVAITGIGSLPTYMGLCAIVNEAAFFDRFYESWPIPCSADDTSWRNDSLLRASIATAWILLQRTRSTSGMLSAWRTASHLRTRAVLVEVRSMYEAASEVLKLETALHLITASAVMVLFFIILIGVVNTLRITIRERTREIGTARAIGMQKSDVLRLFVLESFLLSFFSALAGTVIAFLSMFLLGVPKFNVSGNPLGMLLVDGHLHFMPSAGAIVGFIVFICFLSSVTAWFPARRAARMHPSAALRHFE